MVMKDIVIVYLNFKSKDDIARSLASLFKDIADCPYSVQVVVADNSQNADGIKDSLENNFPAVKYIDCGGNVGFGKGCNAGFAYCEARYYCTLNPDTVIQDQSKTVERIIKFMDSHPKIGMMGPKLLNLDGTIQYSCYRFDLPSILIKPFKQINLDKKYSWAKRYADRLQMKDWDHNETRPVDWIMGSAMIARKAATDQVGFFDDRYFMYMEDSDWCRRMWENGWAVYYNHEIVITHAHARESAKVPGVRAIFKNKLARIHLKSWLQYLWKWKGNFKHYAI